MSKRNDRPEAVTAPALQFDHVSFRQADVQIIDDISLSIGTGEIVCLLGPSGCGKTTLLRIAAGLERPTSGLVHLGSRLLAGPRVFIEPDQRGVGLMFQDYALFPHLTVLGNVMFGLGNRPPAEARKLAMRELARVGLTNHAEDYPHMMSGGEQQRVALARALVPNPTVLLMDEPFSNLDQRMREKIREETVALVREQAQTAVIVTHDPIEAMAVADRIALMRSGRLVQTGTPTELYFRPRTLYAARFLCDMNEIQGNCRDGKVDSPIGAFAAPDLPDGPAVVCVRPQSITIIAEGKGHQGFVQSARCLGETIHLTMAVDGLASPLRISRPTGCGSLPAAGPATFVIDETSVLVFPASEDEAGSSLTSP